nr:hypothetical protein [Pseudoxanthomonas sp.]
MRYVHGLAALLLGLMILALPALSRGDDVRAVESSDIDRFWRAYDRIIATPDEAERQRILEQDFLAPGTPGLKAFMQAKGYDAACYLDAIRRYPKFWTSVRAGTLALKKRGDEFAPGIARFRALYPALRPAEIYFTIGCLRSSGTTRDDKVLIGAELAGGDARTDVSELPERMSKALDSYFRSEPGKQLVLLNVHEYVHTQQQGPGPHLLAQAMYEGAADFVAERITGQVPALPYMTYGPRNEATLKREFQPRMHDPDWSGWLYNGPGNAHGVGDLGYYIGYAIMRDYYQRAPDKTRALAEIIELDYRDATAVQAFLDRSGFYAAE